MQHAVEVHAELTECDVGAARAALVCGELRPMSEVAAALDARGVTAQHELADLRIAVADSALQHERAALEIQRRAVRCHVCAQRRRG
jgi:hypothetical protein